MFIMYLVTIVNRPKN